MKPVEPFDPLGSSLEGTHLIEASAGTGKTYTIACLYLRLILEKELSPEQILVVTFTEAATKELRDRIRKKLRAAVDAFAGGGVEDDFLSRLASLFSAKRDASERLIAALRDFDQAAIYTIHGFCQRMLHENAFESGSLFDTELITEQEHLKREIIEDFWRRHFYTAPLAVIRYALGQNYQPETLLAGLETGRAIPGVKVIPPVSPPSADSVDLPLGELCGALDQLQQSWPESRQAVYDKLLDPALSATTYKSTDKRDEESGRTAKRDQGRAIGRGHGLLSGGARCRAPPPPV